MFQSIPKPPSSQALPPPSVEFVGANSRIAPVVCWRRGAAFSAPKEGKYARCRVNSAAAEMKKVVCMADEDADVNLALKC